MTDRHAAYIVVLQQDIRGDDAGDILTALGMVKGVVSVTPHVADLDLEIAQQRAGHEWRMRLAAMIRNSQDGTLDGLKKVDS